MSALPTPYNQIQASFREGRYNAFIVHGNIKDYASPSVNHRAKGFISEMFAHRQLIIHYNISQGITFPLPGMEDTFREYAGLNDQAETTSEEQMMAIALNPSLAAGGVKPLPRRATEALPLIEKVLQTASSPLMGENGERFYRGEAICIIEFAEMLAPAGNLLSPEDRFVISTLARWGTDEQIEGAGNIAFLLTETLTDIHSTLLATSNRWASIQVPLPDFEARYHFIEACLTNQEISLPDGATPQMIANATSGLSLLSIEDVFLKSDEGGVLNVEFVKQLKQDIIKQEYAGIIEFQDTDIRFSNLTGQEHIKTRFTKNIINPIKEGNRLRVPMGVLLAGPPGTGKSVFARAVAGEAGIAMFSLKIGGQIASKYQGEGERNLARVLAMIKQFAPCLIFIDEIDQALSTSESGGNQQEARIFQMLLEFMADTRHRGEIVFLCATNRPDRIDPRLRRSGRLDEIYAFLAPSSADEYTELFSLYMGKYGMEISPKFFASNRLYPKVKGWTQAEVENICRNAYELTEDEGMSTEEALLTAIEEANIDPTKSQFYINLALELVTNVRMLPPEYRAKAQNRDVLEKEITQAQEYRRKRREL